jgi:photolyase PhrII
MTLHQPGAAAAARIPLPVHLAERLRPVLDSRPKPAGELVLLWLHHAVRGHENPALDAARHAAASLDLPLLVYQGLGGRHRFNADRHHAFILQGVRDAHAELAERHIRAVCHLPMDPAARPSPLTVLARRAALVVTEDFPAPPFPAWTERLAARIDAPVWRLDCACVVPMRLQPRRFARAFELRRHNAGAYAERVRRPWPACDIRAEPYTGPLPFAPLDLDTADIPALCAACAIDHGLPPVPHTHGGSRAGYARWEIFKAQGLSSCHRRRNDAAEVWPLGVSRLSPYLHHGHVSPLRIAREAAAAGGEGAEKFLDELLVWRELAHNFCFFTGDPEGWESLPAWARETLAAHAGDPRERVLDHELLARGATGDRLWDLAQRALLVHGELHNNLRMTWAKAIAHWTESPERALAELIDLNHRHALDGSDPNSYGGLLWALGLFDRPFTPARPVTGSLRARSTKDHARRLDLATYARRVRAPASGRRLAVAVIGAGVAGLAAARTLADQNHDVTVFEKSRGRGGRAATRHIPDAPVGEVAVDHGAQYFTARDPRFRRRAVSWAQRGVVAAWRGRFGVVADGTIMPAGEGDERWVGVPGMSALGRMLSEGLDLRLSTRVAPPERMPDGWLLTDDAGAYLGRFDRVLVAVPAPQAVALLAGAPALAARAAAVGFAPCWTVLAGFSEPPDLPWDGLFVNTGALGWTARNDGKPGRAGAVWVLHGAPDWSDVHLEDAPEPVTAALLAAFGDIVGGLLPGLVWHQVHRWRFARAAQPLAAGCLWDGGLGIGACGDWCADARIEGAWLSGEALAGRVLAAAAADG